MSRNTTGRRFGYVALAFSILAFVPSVGFFAPAVILVVPAAVFGLLALTMREVGLFWINAFWIGAAITTSPFGWNQHLVFFISGSHSGQSG
jgi:hypothetical protein